MDLRKIAAAALAGAIALPAPAALASWYATNGEYSAYRDAKDNLYLVDPQGDARRLTAPIGHPAELRGAVRPAVQIVPVVPAQLREDRRDLFGAAAVPQGLMGRCQGHGEAGGSLEQIRDLRHIGGQKLAGAQAQASLPLR